PKGVSVVKLLAAEFKIPRNSFHDAFMRLCRRASGVHQHHSLRLTLHNLKISFPHAGEEGTRLLLEAVFVAVTPACAPRGPLIAPAGSTHHAGSIGIQKNG